MLKIKKGGLYCLPYYLIGYLPYEVNMSYIRVLTA